MELNNLPQDFIMEILRRLNFKDIMKCKCICKHWLALISNPTFLQYRRQLQLEAQSTSNYKQSSSPIRLLVYSSYNSIIIDDKGHLHLYTFNNNNNEDYGNLKLVTRTIRELKNRMEVISSSFLKLVLLSEHFSTSLYLLNPSTDEFMALPTNYNQGDFFMTCEGLGQVKSTKEYKVVRVIQYSSEVICEVFILGSSYQWREVAAPPIYNFCSMESVFVDGGIYMLDHDFGILRFDIEGEKWMEIKLPVPHKFLWFPSYWTIREVDGLLCMTSSITETINMWVLKDYEKGVWALEKSIYFGYNFRKFFNDDRGHRLIYPLSFDYGDGKMLIFVQQSTYMKKLLSYDPITLHVEELPNPYSASIFAAATFFTESFESLL